MRLINFNNHIYYFSIIHVIKTPNNKLRYDVRLDTRDYVLSKSVAVSDCEQLDNNPRLDPDLVDEICKVLTDIEDAYQKNPSIEYLNSSLFSILTRGNNPRFKNKMFGKSS